MDYFRFICIFLVNIYAGRRFSSYPALHKVRLSKKMRRLLYVVDIGNSEISIVGFIWQIMFIVTILGFCIAWIVFRFEKFFLLYNGVVAGECLFVGIPLGIYSGISQYILHRRGEL